MSGYMQNFDLTNEINILRLICGLFFIPHIYAKFYVPEALGFFVAAKFNLLKTWMYISCIIEVFIAIGLIFAIYPFIAGALGCVHLLIASAAVRKVTKGKWLWNIGGYEYCLFWAICCLSSRCIIAPTSHGCSQGISAFTGSVETAQKPALSDLAGRQDVR